MAKSGSKATDTAAHEAPQVMSGARALIAALEDEGVDVLFGYPGGQVLDIYDALYDSQKIQHILVRHEQAAVHAADGYARTAGKAGVVLVTSGPGATNTITGITNAYMDSVPLVVIAGQVPTDSIGTDAFQEADYLGITLPVIKHSYLIKDVDELVPSIREAFYIATTGRPGPVVICIPSDIAAQDVAYEPPAGKVSIPSYKPTRKGNARQVKQAAELILQSSRPVIIAGGGIAISGAETELKNLAEILQIPVAETLMARGSFPADHCLHLGLAGMHGLPATNLAIMNSDLLIAVGTRFSNRVTGDVERFAPRAKIVHIDIDPAEIGKNVRVDIPIVGDAKEVLRALFEQIQKSDPNSRTSMWIEQIGEWQDGISVSEQEHDPAIIGAQDIFTELNKAITGRDVVFTTEVGEHQMWAARYLADMGPHGFITSGGAGTMGFGFPAAMGIQLAHPDKTVVCLAGDGSFQMNIQEMATCAAYGLPVKVLILNNASLGMVKQLQELFFHKRFSAVDMPRIPDYTKVAEGYGWQGRTVGDPADLAAAIGWLLDADGPAILDVHMSQVEMALPMLDLNRDGALDQIIGVDMTRGGEPGERRG
ncbi:MAG: biosynthetic-type acetolactate synthase large subunit [Coriobacteriales bacterium]|jgi:acetolactate synthase-1/2/3 large subunit